MQLSEALTLIRDIPDFPSSGILFRDITPVLANPQAFSVVTEHLAQSALPYTHVVGIEARGFILGSAISHHTQTGFVPIRKAGKLPHQTISRSYGLEYGVDVIEAHIDALTAADSVLVVDDVLATGGTLLAALEIIAELGAKVSEVVVLFEIEDLGGRRRISQEFPEIEIRSLVKA
ncbi:Apt Adenine/guanine phosphoribosyltransferases and related PRPP-binding proteins [Candidatus Nanopelagicaceae bacterium]